MSPNLNHARLHGGSFSQAKLVETRIENLVAVNTIFRTTDFTGVSASGAIMTTCDFTNAAGEATSFVAADVREGKGLSFVTRISRERVRPVVQRGHSLGANAVAYSPSGELIATGSGDDLVILYRASDGQVVRVLEGHQGSVQSVHFSPDGQTLASGSDDKSVWLWPVSSGKVVRVLEGHQGPVYAVSFAPNGKYVVAAGAAGRLQFWDVAKGETFLYRYTFGPGAWLDLLPDDRFDASPESMRYLHYTERDSLVSYAAEDLVKEFYDPDGVREVVERYVE